MVFHNKVSMKNHMKGITNLNLSLSLSTPYNQAMKSKCGCEYLFGHYLQRHLKQC